MYVNPFVAGIFVTLFAIMFVVLVAAFIIGGKKK